MQTITEQMKSGQLSRFLLLYGEERYMVRYYKNQIVKILGLESDEMNCSHYEGERIDLSELLDVAQTLPFFAEQRLILVENSGFFKTSNDLADFLNDVPDTTYFLFVERTVDKRNRLYKYFSKNGCVTEVKPKAENELVNWVAAYLKSAGKAVTKNTVLLILNKVGTSMEMLSMELEKLIGYAWDKEAIGDSEVEAVCTNQVTNKIFEMVDAVAARNQKKALLLYHDLLALKEPPTRILYLFTRHINQMIQVKEEEGRGSRDELAKKLGIPSFAVGKIGVQAKHFSEKQLLGMLAQTVKMEEDVKSGRLMDQLSVEIFIIKYTK